MGSFPPTIGVDDAGVDADRLGERSGWEIVGARLGWLREGSSVVLGGETDDVERGVELFGTTWVFAKGFDGEELGCFGDEGCC